MSIHQILAFPYNWSKIVRMGIKATPFVNINITATSQMKAHKSKLEHNSECEVVRLNVI